MSFKESTYIYMKLQSLRVISGILLVSGTCIGAGMLALPVVTGLSGFLPAMVINLLCCLFMIATGLLFLEAILWSKEGANILSISQNFLGPVGKIIGGISFLFLYYCLQVSYTSGGTPVFTMIIEQFAGIRIEGLSSYLLFGAVFGFFVFLGTGVVDRLNWLLMLGLFISYILLIGIGSSAVQLSFLKRTNWWLCLAAAPTLFGAYGYHNLLPSLASYLERNVTHLRLSIIFGTLIPFLVYSIWQWMIIGTLSLDMIQKADKYGEPITQTLQKTVGHPWLVFFGEFFGFFALVTSFLGVSLSMVDFLADGLNIRRQGLNRVFLCLAVFLPPAFFAAANPGIFIEAIGVAGGFGEAILNGLFPIAMVWVGRYRLKLSSIYKLPGERPMLLVLLLMTILIIGVEIHHLFF
jgi:tyrosine-specific transport protein